MTSKTTAPTPDHPGRWLISQFGPPSVLKWETFDPLPTPSKDEVLIRLVTAGISGADNLMRVGSYPHPRAKEPGFTPGYDFVGEVVSLGPDVPGSRGLSKGDRVTSLCMMGAYATHIVLPVGDVIKLQKTDDPIKFCALTLNYMTAYGMLKRCQANVGPGSSILIGSVSGGVGTALAQLVRALDMDITMYGTCSAGKFDHVKSLSVTPIDRNAGDLPGRVRELTGGKLVDAAYDAVGSEKSLRDSLKSTKEDTGRVVAIGIMSKIASDGSGLAESDFDPFTFVESQPRISFFNIMQDYYLGQKEVFLKDFEVVAQAVRAGRLDPFVGSLLPLRDAVKANEMLVSGVGVTGKMEFIVDAELAKSKGL